MREENLTKCFEIFRGEISKSMASYFSLGNEHLVFRKDCSECVIPLASQQMAEDMTEEFSTCLDYQVLYEKRTPDGSDYHVALYSIPYENEMVVVIMDSIQHGLIESVKVRFFDSLDTMYNLDRLAVPERKAPERNRTGGRAAAGLSITTVTHPANVVLQDYLGTAPVSHSVPLQAFHPA